MAIQSTGKTSYIPFPADALNRVIHELMDINKTLQGSHGDIPTTATITGPVTVTGGLTDTELRASPVPVNGTVTANIGTIAGLATEVTLSSIDTKVQSLIDLITLDNWDKIIGNSKVISYITIASDKVIDTIEYFTGASLIITQTFTYDADNDIASITAS